MSHPLKLYWVETPSSEENCFVAARSKRSAEKYEEDGSGFNPGDCCAEFIRTLDLDWVGQYLVSVNGPDQSPSNFYVQFEDLHEVGVSWRIVEGDDIFEYEGIEFVKQGDLNYIASLGRRKPEKIIVRSVADLLEIIARDVPGDWIFRGQSSCRWKLEASVHRLTEKSNASQEILLDYERRLLGEFKRRARIFLPTRPSSDWEWMVVAQHFGLPTRILDWTENPLVALYFVVRDESVTSEDGTLYAYRHGAKEIDIESKSDPFSIEKIEFLRPPHLDQRVIAQQSVFTAEPLGLKAGSGNSLSDIRQWNVSVKFKPTIKRELEKLGISENSLFPGLTSLTQEIKSNTPLKIFDPKRRASAQKSTKEAI